MSVIQSALYSEASRRLKQMAVKQFRQSNFGRAMAQVQQAYRAGQGSLNIKRQAQKALGKITPQNTIRQLAQSEFGQIVRQIEKYARGGGTIKTEITKFLGNLGPTGKIIQAIIDPIQSSGLTNDLQAAVNLVRAFGGEVLMPKDHATVGEMVRGLQAAQQRLQEYGFSIVGSEGPPWRVPKPKPGRATIDVEMRPTRNRGETSRVSANHPMLTGEMVRCTASSSVYEFGYDIESLSLYVRFQQSHDEGAQGAAGSLYRYSGVTPEEFTWLYSTRNSGGGSGGDSTPGTWVWEHLRERGTVSGHKKDYELVGVMGGYVPRKATVRRTKEIIGKRGGVLKRRGLEEWYVERTVRTHKDRMVHSVLSPTRVSRVTR